jgi:uncharacterized protein
MGSKVFRDPLYNYIGLDLPRDGWLVDLINCREMQRLRRIHQLGVSNFTYPGADHNRLAHSLGVLHLMKMVVSHLNREEARIAHHDEQPLLAAALLHDVGHGPFSHLFEPCLDIKHESWSIQIVLDEGTEVHKILEREGRYLPQRVAALVEEDNEKPIPWQKALLSSQLDVDRIDYLRRDSLFTGSGYGHFDWFRLLTSMMLIDVEDGYDLVWPEKAALAIEEYIFARYYMYQNVYLHKTTRGFEKLVTAMWQHAAQLHQDGTDVKLVPVLDEFWSADRPSVAQYLRIEEFTVLSQVQAWLDHKDEALSDLARRFLSRDGFAMIKPPVQGGIDGDVSEWETALRAIVGKHYHPADMYCLKDTLAGKYRQPYRPEPESDQQTAKNAIRTVVHREAKPIEISDLLPRLKAVTKQTPDEMRYYVPKNLRIEAQELADSWPSPTA